MLRFPAFLRASLALGAVLTLSTSCLQEVDVTPFDNPQTITFTEPGLYPEGVQYDALANRYFVSSLTRGTIGQVRDNGTYSAFADDPRLVSTIGLQLDVLRNRLLAAVSDPGVSRRTSPATVGQLAALAIINARSGATTGFVNLGALRPEQPHFANDIAVDLLGNAYVTDSFSPIIYKVDTRGRASVFYENRALATAPGAFGFNGIAFHPGGYLLVVHSTRGQLFKIPTGADNPTATVVATSQSLTGGDGLLLQDLRTLLVVSNQQSTVFRLRSTDGFASVSVTGTFATGTTFPTTLTRRGADVYVLYAYLNRLFAGQNPPQAQYSINKVTF